MHLSFPLPKAYTYLISALGWQLPQSPYLAEKLGCGNRDQEAKSFSKREAQEPV